MYKGRGPHETARGVKVTEYVIASNPDARVVQRAARILEGGGLVGLPTDTTWSIVCSIASKQGIGRLKGLIAPGRDRPLTVICSSINQVSELCELDSASFRVIKRLVPGPYVFILNSTNQLAKEFELRRAEIGVRIPAHALPCALCAELGKPLLSITAKRGMQTGDWSAPDFPEDELFSDAWEFEDIPGLDLVLNTSEERERRIATVLDLRLGDVKLMRLGAGPYEAS
jgi:tRNA threonylcarbamoyl adenosine modification protein (Sua5/YciO/YrdC/YwlC family)